MLTTLRIKNLALVTDLTLELRSGFNIITGETGAGKSIVIGALNLILGQRADRSLIRAGSSQCVIEAVFESASIEKDLTPLLDDFGLESCDDGILILKRSLRTSGANRQFVNGSPTTLEALELIGELLVDIHGPHDHQSLLDASRQLEILDAYGHLDPIREEFTDLLKKLRQLEDHKVALIVDDQTHAQQLELLRHQVHEIESAHLDPAAENELEEAYEKTLNASKLLELGQSALSALNAQDGSLWDILGSIGRSVDSLSTIDQHSNEISELHQQTVHMVSELEQALSHYVDGLDLDAGLLNELEERISVVQSLKRKYGPSLRQVIDFAQQAQHKLSDLESREETLAHLNSDIEKLVAELSSIGRKLTKARSKVIPELNQAVVEELKDLGFKQSRFDASLTSMKVSQTSGELKFHSSGLDKVDFQFGPNPGEPMRPLKRIASSGEMARVMLALKSVLADQDRVPVLVFDEVDANVGGETGTVVGLKMQEIGKRRQVISITHLAPVAATAPYHFMVEKISEGDRTVSEIRELNQKDRVAEIARMLGSGGEAAVRHAKAMLDAAT
ncbi:DNA repair protein RecN [Verrucomicrobia bacterium]|nr:DNA repair protein RecN [Verrucomicrobiota bacterium]